MIRILIRCGSLIAFDGARHRLVRDTTIVLARALEQCDKIEDAFAAYQAVRIPRTAFIIDASRRQAAALNQPDPYRYKELRMDGSHSISGYDATTVPI